MLATKPTAPPETSGEPIDRLTALAERGQQGDAAALAEIRQIIQDHPQLWQRYGDLAAHTREGWIKLATLNHPVTAECVRQHVEALRDELGRSSREPLERLLIDRVVACHLQLQIADVEALAMATAPSAHKSEVQKRQASAQFAFFQAERALTTYRQLTKTRPSPVDMLRPQSKVTAGRAVGGRLAQSVGVG